MSTSSDAVAARLRLRDRARNQQQALAVAFAAQESVRRAQRRRAEHVARGDRIVEAARRDQATAMRALIEAAGSVAIAADLLGVKVREVRALSASESANGAASAEKRTPPTVQAGAASR